MKNIEFYITTNESPINKNYNISENKSIYFTYEDLNKQAKNLNIDYSITLGNSSNIPRKTDAFLFVLLEENSLIPDDYLSRIISINNLYRDMSFSCGPRIARYSRNDLKTSSFKENYYKYYIDTSNDIMSKTINKEKFNYPNMYGCVFSGRCYNSVGGFIEKISPRGPIEENHEFFTKLDSLGPAIYHKKLLTYKMLTDIDTSLKYMMQYCYFKGYSDQSLGISEYIKGALKEKGNEHLLASYQLGQQEFETSCKIFDF